MHPFIHHLATTLVTLGIQLMIEAEKILKKENWDVDGKNFWMTIWMACVFIFAAAMLLLRLLLGRRKKRSIEFRFSQRERVPYYMKSFDYDYQ